MKKLLYLAVLFLTLSSCKENEKLLFDDTTRVYFQSATTLTDSVTFSLISQSTDAAVRDVDVRLMGAMLTEAKTFRVEIIEEESTAIEGVHYQNFSEECEFPVDTIKTSFPIEVLKTDPELEDTNFYLTIQLVDTDEITVAYEERSKLKIVITNQIIAPTGTSYYYNLPTFVRLFGAYSRVKHELIIQITGHDFWDSSYGTSNYAIYYQTSYYTPYAKLLYQMIIENDYYDENGDLIEPW